MSGFSARLFELHETKRGAERSLPVPSGEPATVGQFYLTKSPRAVVKVHKEAPKTTFI